MTISLKQNEVNVILNWIYNEKEDYRSKLYDKDYQIYEEDKEWMATVEAIERKIRK